MLTPNSKQAVMQLNQFISQLTNRDTLIADINTKLKRQKTSAGGIQTVTNVDSATSATQQNAGPATSATTARSPSIKKSMERNFTRHTVANTLDNNSRGALLSIREGVTVTSSQLQSKAQTKMPGLTKEGGLQLNQCSGKKLKDLERLSGAVQILANGQVKVEPLQQMPKVKKSLRSNLLKRPQGNSDR